MRRMRLKKKLILYIKTKLIIILIIVIVFTYLLLNNFSKKSLPFLYEYAKNESVNITTSIINKAIYEEIYSGYDKDIVIIEKNSKEEIVDIKYDTQKMNVTLYKISDNILNSINSLRKDKYKSDLIYYVPLGVIYDMPILVNISPKIPYKVSYTGSIDSSINTKITEYGINNALIETVLNINMNIKIIFPLLTKTILISKNIPIYSNVIQGKIPTYYGGVISNSSPINSN